MHHAYMVLSPTNTRISSRRANGAYLVVVVVLIGSTRPAVSSVISDDATDKRAKWSSQ